MWLDVGGKLLLQSSQMMHIIVMYFTTLLLRLLMFTNTVVQSPPFKISSWPIKVHYLLISALKLLFLYLAMFLFPIVVVRAGRYSTFAARTEFCFSWSSGFFGFIIFGLKLSCREGNRGRFGYKRPACTCSHFRSYALKSLCRWEKKWSKPCTYIYGKICDTLCLIFAILILCYW